VRANSVWNPDHVQEIKELEHAQMTATKTDTDSGNMIERYKILVGLYDKMQDMKMQNCKMRHKPAGGGKCESGKYSTKLQGWKMQ